MNEIVKNHWNNNSEEYYQSDRPFYNKVVENPERAFPIAVYPLIKKYIGDLKGKKVCVPSSGDNVAVFGFHLLGAKVTSCDIAENQLKHPAAFAKERGWDIEFVRQDSVKLDKINDGEYDLVYTSNGVHVWIDDLPEMYGNFHRVLKDGGYNIFFETHPVIRPFDDSTYDIKIRKPYEAVGPFGEVSTYGWRTQDFVNAIASAGFNIKEMQEFHSLREDLESHNYLLIREDDKSDYNWPGDTFDWTNNPWAALPQCLCLCSRKG